MSLHDEDGDDTVTPVPVDGREKETKILVVDGSDGGMKQGMNESM